MRRRVPGVGIALAGQRDQHLLGFGEQVPEGGDAHVSIPEVSMIASVR